MAATTCTKTTREVQLDRELFTFESFENWCNTASRKFAYCGFRSDDTICLDTLGRVCRIGEHFMRAAEEKTFPVIAYLIARRTVDDTLSKEGHT